MIDKFKNALRSVVSYFAVKVAPLHWKEFNELQYWKSRKKQEGVLSNAHYQHFYTTHFGLDEDFYADKVIIDIGCGPRGSLEWASMASRRIGLDPLAIEYLKLGASQHHMEYIASPAEAIPLREGECDVVFSFNSLDHVENVDAAIREIKRITRSGGAFLLLVEVNHPPTDCEPHELTPKLLIEMLKPEFACEKLAVYRPVVKGMYDSIRANKLYATPESTAEPGYLSARFTRARSTTDPARNSV